MKTKSLLHSSVAALALLAVAPVQTRAQLPPDFPGFYVTNYNPAAASPGCVFLAVATDLRPTVGVYMMIVTNDGSVVWYHKLDVPEIYDFKLAPNGRLVCAPFIEEHSWTGGGDVFHQVRDENYNLVETIDGGNGYVAEGHDFQLLPNGNVLQSAYYMSEVDVSQFLPGGYPAARVSGGLIQELDAQRNVIFQWRSWDHYGFETNVTSTSAVINGFHLNALVKDTDGQIIVATPEWVKKLNRQTGEIIWHLGGDENQFTFAGGGAPSDLAGHGFTRLPNGNVLIYDNGGRGPNGAPSKVHEYQLDEVNKVATRVWTYTSSPIIKGWHRGNAQRLANGNTFIGWGGAQGYSPTCTEVTPAGEKVFEIWFTNTSIQSYRAFRFDWPPTNKVEFQEIELATGNTYVFTNTGVTLDVQAGAGNYNEFTVTREPYAPVDPIFSETAPQVLPLRVKMHEYELPAMTAQVSFDAASLGFTEPANLTIYHRSQAGQGAFVPQPTTYNPATGQLRTTLTLTSSGGDCGEFIFCHPEVADVPFPPMLAEVENYRGVQTHEVVAPKLAAPATVYAVNQERPVLLSWSPQGLARWFELEVVPDQPFASPVVTESYLTTAFYVWSNAAPNTTYHYRVRTQNDGGAGGWSVGSFRTTPPGIQVTMPNGGQVWQRGLDYFIQWQDNLTEDVVIDLYKGGVFVESLATNSSAGAFQWEAGLDLEPGADYSIRVSSESTPTLFDTSDAPFSIDAVAVSVATAPAGLGVTVDGTNYTAPVTFQWTPGSSHTLDTVSTQLAGDGHSRSVFTSWSDGGAPSHTVTAPLSDTLYTASFTSEYLLDLTVTPVGAGLITSIPEGPWYSLGQLVSLTATANSGSRFDSWTGVDARSANTAEVILDGYRSVTAIFVVDAATVPVTFDTTPVGLSVTVDGTAYTTPVTLQWVPGLSHMLDTDSPQLSGDGHSRFVFSSWSDGGAPSHTLTAPPTATAYTAVFATEYLLDLAVNPTGAGTVTPSPTGPWHTAGQLVSLTANGSAVYEFASWIGADSESGNTAEITMNSYRSVTALFEATNHIYGSMYVSDSLVHYVLPKQLSNSVPIVALPGLGLSSYLYLTTPDGRPGWLDLFADAGFAFYVFNDPLFDFSDGFSVGPFYAPTEGQPPQDPAAAVSWVPSEIWPRWAFGPEDGVPYPDVRFPVSHFAEFTNAFPLRSDAPAGSGQYAANYIAPRLVALLEQTGPAILIGHSAAGKFATKAAELRPDLVLGFVMLEALGVPVEDNFPAFAGKHMLGISCDYVLERGITNRLASLEDCAALFRANGGEGEVIRLPEDRGVFGNTHIVMQDNNSDFVARLIVEWTRQHMLAPKIDAASMTRLPDGHVQFGITALGSPQATVWGATTLSPADWESLGSLPLAGGSATFTDIDSPGLPARFYRVTVP